MMGFNKNDGEESKALTKEDLHPAGTEPLERVAEGLMRLAQDLKAWGATHPVADARQVAAQGSFCLLRHSAEVRMMICIEQAHRDSVKLDTEAKGGL